MAANRQSRPRLGVDFHVWDGIFQGSRSHLVGLYTEVIRQAPDLDLLFLLDQVDSLRASIREFAQPSVHLVRMPHRPAMVRLGAQLPWLQWRRRIDLLHMQYRLPLLPVGPCACTIHDLLFETHPQFFPRSFVAQSRITLRIAARRATLLFSVSEFSKRELVRLYGVDPDRVAVIHNGVDRERFMPGTHGMEHVRALGLEPGDYLLTVGRLEPRKNHVTLVRAYAQLGPEAPPLAIVGQRDFSFSGVFDEIRRLGLESRVRLLEKVGDGALPAVMRHARLFVYPSHAEGFGMPVAEAMASGIPVIASDTSSIPEVSGGAALLVAPEACQELAQAMRTLLNQPHVAAAMVVRGLEEVQRFNWRLSAATFLKGIRQHFVQRGFTVQA